MKEQVVYIDVLIGINLLVNYLLLMVTARIAGFSRKRLRIFLAALLGAVYSFIIFAPRMHFLISLVVKALLACTIVAAAFGIKNRKMFLKGLCIFIMSTFIFGGIAVAAYYFSNRQGILINNSTVYFDISAINLAIFTISAYIVLCVYDMLTRRTVSKEMSYTMTVTYGGKIAKFEAIIDTGNSLRETFSGLPVAVCELSAVKSLLPKEIVLAIDGVQAAELYEKLGDLGLRLVPYVTASGSDMLLAFKPDMVELTAKKNKISVNEMYIGIMKKGRPQLGYSCVLNPTIIDIGKKECCSK